MSKRKVKKSRIKYTIYLISIILLFITTIYFYQENINQEKTIKKLEIKLEKRKENEQLISKYQSDLETIKTLKQEILGQQKKLEEFNIQIQEFTNILIKNQEKLNVLEQ